MGAAIGGSVLLALIATMYFYRNRILSVLFTKDKRSAAYVPSLPTPAPLAPYSPPPASTRHTEPPPMTVRGLDRLNQYRSEADFNPWILGSPNAPLSRSALSKNPSSPPASSLTRSVISNALFDRKSKTDAENYPAGTESDFNPWILQPPPAAASEPPIAASSRDFNPFNLGVSSPSRSIVAASPIPLEHLPRSRPSTVMSQDGVGSLTGIMGSLTGTIARAPIFQDFIIDGNELKIGKSLGRGGFGEVFLAQWHGSSVAVKLYHDPELSREVVDEFKGEAMMLMNCRHPSIVMIMGVCLKPRLGLVTELTPYGSLFNLLHGKKEADVRRRAQLTPQKRLEIAIDIARGLAYLHSRDPVIVHRDLKSPNLLVGEGLRIKVADFGLSRSLGKDKYLSTKGAGGTPQWMSYECMRGDVNVDHTTDVYSYGCVLLELVTETLPWSGMSPEQVMYAVIIGRRLEMPEWVQQQVADLARDCWADDPKERPSFESIIERLNKIDGIQTKLN